MANEPKKTITVELPTASAAALLELATFAREISNQVSNPLADAVQALAMSAKESGNILKEAIKASGMTTKQIQESNRDSVASQFENVAAKIRSTEIKEDDSDLGDTPMVAPRKEYVN